jgi:hypothetical protein
LRDVYEEVRSAGADIVAVGMGRPDMAADFKGKFDIPFRLLVDTEQETYRALDIKRGSLLDVAGPRVWGSALKSFLRGTTAAPTTLDVQQLGGVAIIQPGGRIKFIYRSKTSDDNLPPERLLDELR